MGLTAAQAKAVSARGNVLVVAGAGTGKTTTLVERCLDCLLREKPRASLDEILLVTFTDAAAAEMRQRIRERLEKELAARRQAGDAAMAQHLQEQLALFETAHIGTLHSFCFQLVRQHFYELELDPQLTVLAQEEARLLANETLETVLQEHYAGRTDAAQRVQELIEVQGRGWDQPIRLLVLRLYHYMQTRPDAAGWFTSQRAMFGSAEPEQWLDWLRAGITEWARRWTRTLEPASHGNEIAAGCTAMLETLVASADDRAWRAKAAVGLERIMSAPKECPHGKKGAWITPLKNLFEEAEFLSTLTVQTGETDPLAEDWNWVREEMLTLLDLVREFTEAFREAKRELGAVDFHDLEQYALRLLWNPGSGEVSAVGKQWRERLRFVFVDEYQDINAAQDRIIQGLSREGRQSNRFLVGDVKQSIYRFRLAEPTIFRNYADTWRHGGGVIPLVDNFRSREGILDFVNSLFSLLMRRDLGGIEYDDEARLRFGSREKADTPADAQNPGRSVELHFRVRPADGGREAHGAAVAPDGISDLDEANKEARMVAMRLRKLVGEKFQIHDPKTQAPRAVEWSDMAVLLRSPANKAESYAKEFAHVGVPLQVARGGFYESLEISDLLSLLQILDNPLQDLPLLAVLRSPLVGMRLEELAQIRLASQGPFWTALVRCHETGARDPGIAGAETVRKINLFLERFGRWRRLARQVSLSQCLHAVLSETHYADWLLTQERGEQRRGNALRLLALARQFDEFQRQGLYRFLRFIEAQQTADTEPEVAPIAAENAVRLMSIHQSKGLEFPIVVVADLGKSFNEADLRADLILDEQYGLCPQVKPPKSGTRYPSLPHWLARRRQYDELLAEELRLLYVAVTRARTLLILTGGVTERKFDRDWAPAEKAAGVASRSVRSYADWLGTWFSQHVDATADHGENALLRWTFHRDATPLETEVGSEPVPREDAGETYSDPDAWQKIQKRLAWSYPFADAVRLPAKTSVTALRRLAAQLEVDEIVPLFEPAVPAVSRTSDQQPLRQRRWVSTPGRSAVEAGKANHLFLQLLPLERTGTAKAIGEELNRLQAEGTLTARESEMVDIDAVSAFWQSEIGRKVREQAQFVRRELPFTARFPAAEVAALTGGTADASLGNEFIVVQGIADLAVILPQEIWLVDFKTDVVTEANLADKVSVYSPQLKLYSHALSNIYQRPVSQRWLYFLTARTPVAVPGA